MAGESPAPSPYLDAQAFKLLYPEQYFEKFVQHSVRPDGRPFTSSRPVSISHDIISTANASALVKVGSTIALAGIKIEVMPATDEAPHEGQIIVQVEMPPLCSTTTRPGRPSETARVLTEQLTSLMDTSNIVDLSQLCIDPGKAAWAVYIDIYILNADGALHDACVIAMLAALQKLELPIVSLDEHGNVVVPTETDVDTMNDMKEKKVHISSIPLSVTCCLHHHDRQRHQNISTEQGDAAAMDDMSTTILFVDPTADEEQVADSVVTLVLDGNGDIVKMIKSGGSVGLTPDLLVQCHEAAKMRYNQLIKHFL